MKPAYQGGDVFALLICQEHYSSPEKRKSIWQYTTFLFIERAA
jgi:hypothetical protein